MDLLIGILASLAAVGIINIAYRVFYLMQSHLRFLPFKSIWKEFIPKETLIILTGREQGHTKKISFNEVLSADRIQKLLKLSGKSQDSQILVVNGDYNKFANMNIIVLGSEKINPVSKEIMKHISSYIEYSYTAENDLIINGEIFKSVYENDVLVKDYGLVIKTVNPYNTAKHALLFSGNHGLGTQASVLALTEEQKTTEIVGEIGNAYFYAVIESSFDQRFTQNPLNIKVIRCGLLSKSKSIQPITPSFSREDEVKKLMSELGASEQLINHSFEVARLAKQIGLAVENRGKNIDMEAVYFGSILHDIGRVKSMEIDHGIEGVNILYSIKDSFLKRFYITTDTFNKIVESIECHIVGGIKVTWITSDSLKLPTKNYIAKSLEAKIVAISDQIIHRRGESDIVLREAPSRDAEVLANLYKLTEELLLCLYYDKK
jgi:uncharacterized protein